MEHHVYRMGFVSGGHWPGRCEFCGLNIGDPIHEDVRALRDHFAAAALTGLVLKHSDMSETARLAYFHADRMLAERAKEA